MSIHNEIENHVMLTQMFTVSIKCIVLNVSTSVLS